MPKLDLKIIVVFRSEAKKNNLHENEMRNFYQELFEAQICLRRQADESPSPYVDKRRH